MKKVILIGLVLGIFGLGKLLAAAPDDALASYHFIGSAALVGNTNAAKLKKIWALPETVSFRDDVLQKLARASCKIFSATDTNGAALLRPLLDDLLVMESRAELRAKTNSGAGFFLAVRLDENRSRVWETNLLRAAKSTKPDVIKMGESSGWRAKLGGANVLKFVRAGKWTVVLIGGEQSTAQLDFINRIKNENSSTGKNWLEADIDWPRLHPWLPLDFSPFKPARTEIKINGRGGEDLRTTVRIIYPNKLDWKPEPWKIPSSLIRDPLISFTAAQKIAPFFKPSFRLQEIKINPLTNQIYFWALSEMPFQSYVAMPVANATNTCKTLVSQLPTVFNESLKRRDGGVLEANSNQMVLSWKGLPIIAPFLGPAKSKTDGEFLLGGIFPLTPNTNKPPAELFKQISGRNDLVFYDWEITQMRLLQWQTLSQVLPVFSKNIFVAQTGVKRLAPPRVPEQKWLTAVGPMLGNTITEVTYKSPNELNVVRKSHIGLNSLELVLLSHWLAHPNFPFVNPFAATVLAENSPPVKSK